MHSTVRHERPSTLVIISKQPRHDRNTRFESEHLSPRHKRGNLGHDLQIRPIWVSRLWPVERIVAAMTTFKTQKEDPADDRRAPRKRCIAIAIGLTTATVMAACLRYPPAAQAICAAAALGAFMHQLSRK